MKILHTGDIHIRPTRHDEWKYTFEFLIKDAKERKVDHIFISGDLWHTKTQGLNPESIDFLVWFFKSLAAVAPVHIILGNHDGNLTNLSRQDAITPIIDAINNPNIKLYKKSGIYQIEPGYNFCVFSIFDEENWDKVKPIQGDVNIACYHGPLKGSLTEINWVIEDGLSVDFFNEYQVVLLGDIHKTQFLGYREQELEIDEDDLQLYSGAEVI